MLIWDAHLDLATNALNANRNLFNSVEAIRNKEAGRSDFTPIGWGAGEGTIAFPEMRKGRVAVCFATLMAGVAFEPKPHVDFQTPEQAYAVARGHLAYYQALEKKGFARILTHKADLDSHIKEWENWEVESPNSKDETPPLGLILSFEGTDPVLKPDELEEWFNQRVSIVMIGHFGPGRYGGGTGTDLPLNDLGKALLDETRRLGMIFDINHLSDQAFWQAIEHYPGPVFASHSNSRALVPGQRQLSDRQMQTIIKREGVIGVCADVWMLEPDWVAGVGTNKKTTLDTMAQHIDHICNLSGNSFHAGIGTDLDGGYGYKQCPNDLNTIADIQKLTGFLSKRGYSETDIQNIFYKNFYRFVSHCWKD